MIKDKYGKHVYTIRGEYLFDPYGSRIGEVRYLGDILPAP
jgi:hypothetical protein